MPLPAAPAAGTEPRRDSTEWENRLPAAPAGFDWGLHPAAEEFLAERIDELLSLLPPAQELADRMNRETATQLADWLDHLVLPDDPATRRSIEKVGFRPDPLAETAAEETCFAHPFGVFGRIVLRKGGGRDAGRESPFEIALKPERIADMAAALDVQATIEGPPLSRYRRAVLATGPKAVLSAVERRGYRGFLFEYPPVDQVRRMVQAEELWHTRPRGRVSEDDALDAADELLGRIEAMVGLPMTGHLFFEAERAYWCGRNTIARFQKSRQDRLGLGWGNHDHHTYRSSRRHFARLIAFQERMGFRLRERFWAGAEAGWGAQILEHPVLDIVCFNDVDLAPDETDVDFAHRPLPARDKLGTVGLWCGLHGESLLRAGMHHLECRFDFDKLKADLETAGLKQMKPFSDLPFLRQAFTEGERWPVDRVRAESLRAAGLITPEQCARFVAEGTLGSHLENLQRWQGFKGFNQKSVSVIIAATDPRKAH